MDNILIASDLMFLKHLFYTNYDVISEKNKIRTPYVILMQL